MYGLFSGNERDTDCFVGNDNIGCGFDPPSSDLSSYGDGFNAADGGVYAMDWDEDFISIWHFPRDGIPKDIEAKKPNPKRWGRPQAIFGGKSCDVDTYFKDMSIVLNIVSWPSSFKLWKRLTKLTSLIELLWRLWKCSLG